MIRKATTIDIESTLMTHANLPLSAPRAGTAILTLLLSLYAGNIVAQNSAVPTLVNKDGSYPTVPLEK
ncbi:MAG: hypothetical protein AAF552_10450, partial [Pseudomonadota bacterium]